MLYSLLSPIKFNIRLHHMKQILIVSIVVFIYCCSAHNPSSQVYIQKIFYNGDIVTMTGKGQIAEAVAISGDKIVAVGTLDDVQAQISPESDPEYIDLDGHTLLPGFYDAHSHFTLNAITQSQGFDLYPPPIGRVQSIKDIQNNIREYIEKNSIPQNTAIFGVGYSDLALAQKRHPNRHDLDEISTKHLIFISHISVHMAVCNSLMIQRENISMKNQTKNINETVILEESGQPSGLLKLQAIFLLKKYIPQSTIQIVRKGQHQYFQSGTTTAQDILNYLGAQPIYQKLGQQLKIDIIAYRSVYTDLGYKGYYYSKSKQTNRFKVKGVKLVFDGSIQGYTAYFTKPYLMLQSSPKIMTVKNVKKDDSIIIDQNILNCQNSYCGFPIHSNQTAVNQLFKQFYLKQIDIHVHCNGDAASDLMIEAVRFAIIDTPFRKTKFVMIHAQNVREDQLNQIKKLGIIISFFPSHVYYWGKSHRDVFLGLQRASRINPLRSALDRQISFTIHHDAPITPILPNGVFQTIWSAVNRVILDNEYTEPYVLGPQQRIDIYSALQAVTIDSAYQSGEEMTKGSIEVGKLADLIIVDKNPLKMRPIELRNNHVLQTYKRGELVYKLQQTLKAQTQSI